MSIKVEKTENKNELKLEFKFEAKRFEDAIKSVYSKTAKYFNVAGFRKGKAPLNIVERYYGSQIFYEDALNEILEQEYEKELKDNNIEPVSKPDVDVVQMEKGKELIFTVTVQIKPEVKLGKYKGIEIKKIEYNVSDKDVEHELGHMAEQNARLVSVENRAVKDGDTTIIDFEGFVDGTPFEGGKAENHELVIGSKSFIEGFEDQIIGMKLEQEKEIKVTFPKEYFSKDLAGKDATFKVKLHEIKEKELPKIDDEFAKDVSEFNSLKELKDSIKEKIQKENDSKAKFETEEAAIEAVTKQAKLDVPSGMIESEIDSMVRDIQNRLKYQGMTLEQYLQFIGKTNEEFRKEYEEQAKKAVTSRLVLEAIFVDAKLEVSDKEIDEKLKEIAEKYGQDLEKAKENEDLKSYIIETLKFEKALDYIISNSVKK